MLRGLGEILMLEEYAALLPADKQEAYKTAIKNAVIITSREDAEKVLKEHPFIKSAYDADSSRRYAEMEKNYQDQKIPGIVKEKLAEELKKGQKSPEMIEIEKLRAEADASKKLMNIEKQKARALLKAQEQGIPPSLIDRFVGETDEATDEGLKQLAGVLTPWRDDAVKSALAKFGNMPDPLAGNQNPQDLKSQLDAAMKAGNADLALTLQSKLQDQTMRT
jgi:hypothetical protein